MMPAIIKLYHLLHPPNLGILYALCLLMALVSGQSYSANESATLSTVPSVALEYPSEDYTAMDGNDPIYEGTEYYDDPLQMSSVQPPISSTRSSQPVTTDESVMSVLQDLKARIGDIYDADQMKIWSAYSRTMNKLSQRIGDHLLPQINDLLFRTNIKPNCMLGLFTLYNSVQRQESWAIRSEYIKTHKFPMLYPN